MENIPAALQSFDLAEKLLPIWTNWGILDTSCSIHSLGVSFLTLLGKELDYVAVSEFPVPRQGQYAHAGNDVRCDSVWFHRQTRSPVLLSEFERYTGNSDRGKLKEKVKNLLLAHHRWSDTPRWLVLAYWTEGLVSPPDHSQLHHIVKQGFETPERFRVEGARHAQLLCFQFILEKDSSQALRLHKIIQRGSHESS